MENFCPVLKLKYKKLLKTINIFKIVSLENGTNKEALKANEEGELWLRSAAVMKGYLEDELETKKSLDSDGWLHTGKLYKL